MKLFFFALLAMCALLFGCSPKATLVGTWNVKGPETPGNSITYVFNKDRTYTYVQNAVFESIRSHQSASGTYQAHGNILTLNTTQEVMGIDADAMAAIDAREAKLNPNLHIRQDKADVPVAIEQPITNYLFTLNGDDLKLKDTSNYADRGVHFIREHPGN